jgi:DNA repair protein RecO (recombination protein O)
MPTVKDTAVVLRLMDWSETSQILVMLTREHGKISAAARGAKRQQPSTLARFSGGLELLTVGQAVAIVKPAAELANLIEWNLLDPQWHLRRDWRAYGLAMFAVDLIHHVVQDHDAHPATFDALRRFLAELADADRAAQQQALLRFQWAVVGDMGLKPVLDRDAQTGGALDEAAGMAAFSPRAGGTVADSGGADRWRVRMPTIQLLRALEAGRDAAGADPRSVERANRLLCSYFRVILDKELATMDAVMNG